MTAKTRRSAFTLIEVLIVVVIMAVLAATIIPQFSSSTKDARESSQKFNLQSLRTQVELYKVQHNGNYPAGANNLEQLTKATDSAGAVSTTGQVDGTHPFGPYVQGAMPAQPSSVRAGWRAREPHATLRVRSHARMREPVLVAAPSHE